MLDEYKAVVLNKENFFKQTLDYINSYGKIIYITVIALMLLFDYFVYTDVFHLNQADFFNYLLSNILTQQFFIVFIIFPLIIIGLILFIFRIEYSFLEKFEIKNYFILNQCKFWGILIAFIFFIVAFLGDIAIYNLLNMIYAFLEKQAIRFNLIAFFVIVNILLFIVNIASLILLVSLTKIISNKIISIKVYMIFSLLLGLFFALKLSLYPMLALLVPKLNLDYSQKFFTFFNLIIFVSLSIMFIVTKDLYKKAGNKTNNDIFAKSLNFFILLFFIILYTFYIFYTLENLYKTHYESYSFWKNKIYDNSLSTFNFSLLLSPLRISQFYEKINFENIFEKQIISDFIIHKKINHKISGDINQTIHHLILDSNSSQRDIFYLPNGDRKLLFILNDSNQSDINQTITILHVKENNSSVIKLIDIGYINCKSK